MICHDDLFAQNTALVHENKEVRECKLRLRVSVSYPTRISACGSLLVRIKYSQNSKPYVNIPQLQF